MKGAFQTVRDLDIEPTHSGKVRETIDLGDTLFIVTTDRISAFDVVLPEGLAEKGKILNGLTTFWFRGLGKFFPTHFLGTEPEFLPEAYRAHADALAGRWMRVRKAERLPVECVVRGYITGSGWSEYQKVGSVCGIPLPPGLKEFDRLAEPIFTPTTKADEGHDMPMTPSEVIDTLGADVAREVERMSKEIYSRASEYALARGVIIADTKFEFGWIDGKLSLIDEALTPDSSRFWPKASLENRGPDWKGPDTWDKQYVRDYLKTLDWNREPPGPALPADVEVEALARYRRAVDAITEGKREPEWEA
ncbi:MAG: phosphoribosylaminoimidazolesuccinocarboxamide synthase [Candidatus Eisenbacteria bacterium]